MTTKLPDQKFRLILSSFDPLWTSRVQAEIARVFQLDDNTASSIVSAVPIVVIDGLPFAAAVEIRGRLEPLLEAGCHFVTTDEENEDVPRINWPEIPEFARRVLERVAKQEAKSGPVERPAEPSGLACPSCGQRFSLQALPPGGGDGAAGPRVASGQAGSVMPSYVPPKKVSERRSGRLTRPSSGRSREEIASVEEVSFEDPLVKARRATREIEAAPPPSGEADAEPSRAGSASADRPATERLADDDQALTAKPATVSDDSAELVVDSEEQASFVESEERRAFDPSDSVAVAAESELEFPAVRDSEEAVVSGLTDDLFDSAEEDDSGDSVPSGDLETLGRTGVGASDESFDDASNEFTFEPIDSELEIAAPASEILASESPPDRFSSELERPLTELDDSVEGPSYSEEELDELVAFDEVASESLRADPMKATLADDDSDGDPFRETRADDDLPSRAVSRAATDIADEVSHVLDPRSHEDALDGSEEFDIVGLEAVGAPRLDTDEDDGSDDDLFEPVDSLAGSGSSFSASGLEGVFDNTDESDEFSAEELLEAEVFPRADSQDGEEAYDDGSVERELGGGSVSREGAAAQIFRPGMSYDEAFDLFDSSDLEPLDDGLGLAPRNDSPGLTSSSESLEALDDDELGELKVAVGPPPPVDDRPLADSASDDDWRRLDFDETYSMLGDAKGERRQRRSGRLKRRGLPTSPGDALEDPVEDVVQAEPEQDKRGSKKRGGGAVPATTARGKKAARGSAKGKGRRGGAKAKTDAADPFANASGGKRRRTDPFDSSQEYDEDLESEVESGRVAAPNPQAGDYGLVLSRISNDGKRKQAAQLIAEIQGVAIGDALRLTERYIIPVLKEVSKDLAETHLDRFREIEISGRVTRVRGPGSGKSAASRKRR